MAESIRIVDPTTGAPVLAQITKTGLWMMLATQIFPYTIPRDGQQHAPPLQNVYVDEALSHAVGFNLYTHARTGQILAVEVLGTGQEAAVSKIT